MCGDVCKQWDIMILGYGLKTDLGLASSITGCVTWGELLHLSVSSSVRWE